VTGLLISLWGQANSLFITDKYHTLTGRRIRAGYVVKRKHVQNISFDITTRSKQHVRVIQWRVTAYTIYNYFDITVYIQQYFLWFIGNLYIEHFDTTDIDLSSILGSNN